MAVVTRRDSGRWQAKVRRRGYPPTSKTFATRAAADAWARHVERQMDTDAFLPTDDAARMTLADLADRYAREVLPGLRSRVQDGYLLARIVERFGQHALSHLTPHLLSQYRDERLKAVSPQTVRHELGMLSRLFSAAILDWKIALPKGNPVSQMRKPSAGPGRSRRLEPAEEDSLLAALEDREVPWPKAAFVLAVETAARQSELLSLRWVDVDLESRVARIRGKDGRVTKNGDAWRDVPLTTRAVEVLRTLPRSIEGRVLPMSANALQMAWERSLRQARKTRVHDVLCHLLSSEGLSAEECAREIRALVYKKRPPLPLTLQLLGEVEQADRVLVDLRWHDLRHEATARLADRLAMHELMKATGHKTAAMVMRYYQPRAADLARKLA